jgi:hypothetical protein
MTEPSRRMMLAALAAAPIAGMPTLAGAAVPIRERPNAELLRLGEEFEQRHVALLPIDAECNRLTGLFDEAWNRGGLSMGDNFEVWKQLRIETGVEAAIEAEDKAFGLIDAVTTKIREMPAKTFAGLAVKARALRFDALLNAQCDLPQEDQDWPEYVMNEFVAEIDRLAAAELSEWPRA